MAVGLLWFSFVPSTFESWWDYLIVAPAVAMIGIGIGTVFPATNVGAMGSVGGPELGLASGVVNTARQLGSALGVALLIAAVITASDFTLDFAREDVEDANEAVSLPPAMTEGILMRSFGDYVGQTPERSEVEPGFEEQIAREAAGAARDGYGWAFRVAGLIVLLAIPFARRMVNTPAASRAAAAAAAAAAAGPPSDGERAPPAPAAPDPAQLPARERQADEDRDFPAREQAGAGVETRIAQLEASLRGLRSELDDGGARAPAPTTTAAPAAEAPRGGDAAAPGNGHGARHEPAGTGDTAPVVGFDDLASDLGDGREREPRNGGPAPQPRRSGLLRRRK
jgi:hypothetical protein